MSECPSLEIQDLLPDFVAERLDARTMGAVADHLQGCGACRADVAVIRSVRRAGASVVASHGDRIVAAVLAASHPGSDVSGRPALQVVAGDMAYPLRPATSSMRSSWRRIRTWQMAAALAVCVTGAYMTMTTGRRGSTVVSDTLGSGHAISTPAPATIASSTMGATVSYGDLTDYSEGELEAMLATLEGWDGASRAEPPSFEPVLSPDGGRVP